MKALKGLVIGMGLLIVIGLGLLGYGVMRNMGKVPAPVAAKPAAEQAIPALPTAGARTYFSAEVSLAPGESLEQMAAVGDRLALRIVKSADQGGEQRIVLIDPASGQIGGSIALVPQGQPKR